MSADDGIYILQSPVEDYSCFEYRVIHAQAIENLYWCEDDKDSADEIQPEMLMEYFGSSEVFWDKHKAWVKVFQLEKDMKDEYGFGPEYGISMIRYDQPFPKDMK